MNMKDNKRNVTSSNMIARKAVVEVAATPIFLRGLFFCEVEFYKIL